MATEANHSSRLSLLSRTSIFHIRFAFSLFFLETNPFHRLFCVRELHLTKLKILFSQLWQPRQIIPLVLVYYPVHLYFIFVLLFPFFSLRLTRFTVFFVLGSCTLPNSKYYFPSYGNRGKSFLSS